MEWTLARFVFGKLRATRKFWNMEHDPERVAWWRNRADQYRAQALESATPGSALAYEALADCADSLADRMDDGSIALRKKRTPVIPGSP
jgi:hypothetical protein